VLRYDVEQDVHNISEKMISHTAFGEASGKRDKQIYNLQIETVKHLSTSPQQPCFLDPRFQVRNRLSMLPRIHTN
jgi:hypothetical protein